VPSRVHRTAYLLGLVLVLYACAHVPYPADPASQSAPRDPYVEALVERAHALSLARKPQWHKLLHYQQGLIGGGFLGGGYTSEADGRGFFLSPAGKLDPSAELDATLRGLFLPLSQVAVSRYQRREERGADAHPLCRFPARYMFLQRELGIDVNRLPVTRCPMLEQFLTELNAESVTLIFSAYYLNNPASAFGHTFLRFNKANTLAVGERRELLDYGIDFSADVDTSNALIYAIKGLTGMFPGTFKRIPYFYKVREYNDYEARDLWEYELELNREQLMMLTAHLWELGHTYFAYFYLSENCSYHILAGLEVARPELDLVGRLVSPVIPADTIKVVYATPGLVRKVSYRPSLRKQFEARVSRLNGEERALVEELAQDADRALPAGMGEDRRIAVLDAAADLVDVLYARDLIHKSDSDAARRKQRVLERRAQILAPSEPLQLSPPLREAPEHGHGSRRVGLGAATTDGAFAPTAEFRLSLHDLADASDGYLELSAIEFMRARVQLWPGARLELDQASIFRVVSLTPQTRFDRKMSWELDVGAAAVEDSACDRCLAAHIRGGAGLSFALLERALSFWLMGRGAFLYGPGFEGLEESHVRLGIGPSGGLRLRLTPELIALVTAYWLWLPAQQPETTYEVSGTLRWEALTDLAFGVEGRRVPVGYEGLLLTFVYF
jgi:hypothetical protein